LPASEVRGEGVFLRIREEVLLEWQQKAEVRQLEQEFLESHKTWRKLRNLSPVQDAFPGIRLILLHSLSHALMRQIVLDCSYTAASVRERLYSRQPGEEGGPMAGILLYTAAPDSEGTLGGLVEMGSPQTLGRHMQQALENMRICAPIRCVPNTGQISTGAAFTVLAAMPASPETSCERGNRYLDRSVLVNTFSARGTAFFDEFMDALNRQIVLITRKTRLDDLVVRFNTIEQGRFHVEHLGGDFSDYEAEHKRYNQALVNAEAILRAFGRVHRLDRSFLSNYFFAPDALVVVFGQDGLVANTLKYLKGAQPMIGVNLDPGRWGWRAAAV
jgi:hypothetical protein